MATISLKNAKAELSAMVDKASAGEFVTITRHGKPTAVLVSVDAAEVARRAVRRTKESFADHLLAFPEVEDDVFQRNVSPSRDAEF
ncbi:type II toxin-antitoxin system Phd/YefM family antitoxin [Aliirhizobium terrae]|uniref:type II toxin-antitoxin system Phd/YefM family antitoxin n=1 Tax=Terrirhizobium terrae TaxID=2926709 RepID=UPI00257708BC|nr:type II toxin-antitoxin system Phd/YefM family antitoxin [Rhizobium sp. CC-CFT758]WJH40289.1 type II toxin-antitoxin system Phd/YefM family antitoxin [Rhizobium sp. CC-CFT758]